MDGRFNPMFKKPGDKVHRCRTTAVTVCREALTFSPSISLERRADLLVRHIEPLREAVKRTRAERPFHIDAWVVLPDHIHCVMTLPPGDDDFSNRIKAIKIRFVQALAPMEGVHRYEGRRVKARARGSYERWPKAGRGRRRPCLAR